MDHESDILIVGAGPTGLALCAQLCSFGVRARIIDRGLDRAHESRALGVQARTLELLQSIGLGDALVARGNPSARLMLHVEGRVVAEAELGGFAGSDTKYPFVLFVSQAETEKLLGDHLAAHSVTVERGIELGTARQPEPLEKGSGVQRDCPLQVARVAELLELRDVALDDSGVESQLAAATDRVRRAEVAAKHVDRLAQDGASAFLIGVRPQKREQPLSRHTAPSGARQHREDCLPTRLRSGTGNRTSILLDREPTQRTNPEHRFLPRTRKIAMVS